MLILKKYPQLPKIQKKIFDLLENAAEKFAYSLEPDQARQNVAPDQVPNCLVLIA